MKPMHSAARRGALPFIARVLLAAVAAAPPALAQDPSARPSLTLDLQTTLRLAREQAPAAAASRHRVAEAQGLLDEASLPFASNPELEVGAGRRARHDGGHGTDWSIGLRQQLESSGRRDARIDSATSEVDAATSASTDALRLVLARAAAIHLRTLHALQARAVLEEASRLADAALAIARQRSAAGDAAALDEQLGIVGAAHAASEAARARAEERLGLAELCSLLGLPGDAQPVLVGPLEWPSALSLADALAESSRRPDVAEAAARLRQAEAETLLAESERRPDVAVRLGYARDDRDRIVELGFDVGLPFFGRGEGLVGASAARASRLRGELAALRNAAEQDVRGAWGARQALGESAAAPQDGIAVALAEAERIARRRFESGDSGLAELLAVRRELQSAQLARLDRLLDIALAGLELAARSGLLTEEGNP